MKRLTNVFISAMFSFFAVVSAIVGGANNNSWNSDYHKEFKVTNGGDLTLKLKIACDIQIIGNNSDLLIADLDIYECNDDEVVVDFKQTGTGVIIETKYVGSEKSHVCRGSVKVTVPEKFNVEFETMGGDIVLKKINGIFQGSTMGGGLDLSDLKGKVDLSTMGGEITLIDSDVDGKLSTMGGDVFVRDVTGDISASSMGGDVIQQNVSGRSENRVSEEINWTTMGGDIEIDEAPNGAKVKTMGGDIKVNKVTEFIRAETMGGDIDIKDVDGWVKASTMGGEVKVRINNAGGEKDRSVKLSSMGGDIYLYAPADFSMDVEIEIKYDKNRKNNAEIKGDFSLNEVSVDNEDDSWGGDGNMLRGYGSFNGGKHKVYISTINSKVYLLRK